MKEGTKKKPRKNMVQGRDCNSEIYRNQDSQKKGIHRNYWAGFDPSKDRDVRERERSSSYKEFINMEHCE